MDSHGCRPAPDVSIVIPAYRAAGFIHRAIDSALEQHGVLVEVLVVDDACPLGTADAVEDRYGSSDQVSVIRFSENRGPAAARNAGFAAARGTWVAVLDADDAFEPGRLAHLVPLGRDRAADVVADNVRLVDPVRGTVGPPRITSVTAPTEITLHALVAAARPGTGELDYGLLKPMFRRAFLDAGTARYPEDVRHGEDFLFYVDLLHAGARFLLVPEPGYLWTVRSSGQSQTKVDYLAQVADARRLQQLDWVRADPSLVSLLDDRARGLLRLQDTWNYTQALKGSRYLGAVAACIRHPHLMRRALRAVASRLGAH